MSKELEALEELRDFRYGKDKLLVCQTQMYLTIKTSLHRLEAIDNSNPSEALEYLEEIKNYFPFVDLGKGKEYVCEKEFNTIKQALLKAQEPKCYLKWENLEFKKEEQIMEVIFNGSKYKLSYFTDGILEYVDLLTNNEKFLIGRYVCDYEKQFFNDLHLERVEE